MKIKDFIQKNTILKGGMIVAGLVVIGSSTYIMNDEPEKTAKNTITNKKLVKTAPEKKVVMNFEEMKANLISLEEEALAMQSTLQKIKIPTDKISKLNKDSLSFTTYVNKQSEIFKQHILDLESKIQQVPLGMPTEGYLSSNFGKRKNPIPTKREVVMASVGTTTKTITKTEVITPEPRIVQVRDSTGKLIQEVKIQPKPKTVTTTEIVQIAQNGKPTVKTANNSPAEADQIQFHKGVDMAVAFGTDVKTTADGKIVFAGVKGGYGNCVIVSHANGLTTLYGHLSKLLVKTNQIVKASQVIAKSGNSGRSTGPHLHYEVHKNNQPINPKTYMTL